MGAKRKRLAAAGRRDLGEKISSGRRADVVSLARMKAYFSPAWFLAALCGCATANLTPGATLLGGMHRYQGEMQSLGSSPARWPERQQAAASLKTVVLVTLGGSREFFRMVDLDLRKREFEITMRETGLRADRLREMKDEIVKMNEEIAALKPIVKAQVAAMPIQGEGERRIDGIATRGLLDLALAGFSTNGAPGIEAPSTKVDQYMVTDLGSFATVRAPDGQTFRCVVVNVPEEGGWVRCESIR
jgi:hypothetical protein